MFNPFKKSRKATDMTTPENDPTVTQTADQTAANAAAPNTAPADQPPADATQPPSLEQRPV